MSVVKLFCLPYAGGSAAIFSKWKRYLNVNNGVELVPLELSGRGRRILEPLYADLLEATEDLYQMIKVEIVDSSYAFFGHSLGGLLVYELAQKIKQADLRQPLHLFFSGRSAPNIERHKEEKFYLMNDSDFKQKVIELGGTSTEFFDHPELIDLFLPLLRNDFRLAETNLTERKVDPFSCDISVFLGKRDDEITAEQADAWKVHTKGRCSLHYFNGDHFFLHNEVAEISELINIVLTKQRRRSMDKIL